MSIVEVFNKCVDIDQRIIRNGVERANLTRLKSDLLNEIRNTLSGAKVRIKSGSDYRLVECEDYSDTEWPIHDVDKNKVFNVANNGIRGEHAVLIGDGFGSVHDYGEGPIICAFVNLELVEDV
jgi:hypothetical protein